MLEFFASTEGPLLLQIAQFVAYLAVTVVAGIWVVRTQSASRASAASWIGKFLNDLYVEQRFYTIRCKLEYSYNETLKDLIASRLQPSGPAASEGDQRILFDLDSFLNVLESALYLESEGQIRRSDRQAIFEYWFSLLAQPRYQDLQRYISSFGYDRIAREIRRTQRRA